MPMPRWWTRRSGVSTPSDISIAALTASNAISKISPYSHEMHLEKKRSRLAHDAVWHDSIFTSNPSGLRTGMRALAVRLADQRASPRRPSRTWWQPFRNTCRDVSCGQSHFIQTRTREWYLLSARTHTHTHTYVRPYTHPLRLYYLSTKPPVKLSHLLTCPTRAFAGRSAHSFGPRVGARRIQSLLGGPRQKLCTHGTALFWMRTLALPSGCRSPFIGILGTGRSEERRGCVTLTEIGDTHRAIPLPLSLSLKSHSQSTENRRVLRCVFTVHARASVYEHASRSAHYRNNRARAACGAEVQFCKEGPLG